MSRSSLNNKYDAVVIGGGPAGAAAAYFLAEGDARVILLEKEKVPRYKTCGGGLVYRLVEKLPFDIDTIAENVCFGADVYDHASDLHFKISREKPIMVTAMRSGFDSFLLEHAVKKGAEISDSEEVTGLEELSGEIEVRTNKNVYRAKYVIAADGATGFASRKFNHHINVRKIPALEYEMYVDKESLLSYKNRARFDFGVVPHGYGWVFPKSGHLSVGV